MFVPTRFLPGHHDPWLEPDRRWRRAGYLLRHRRRPLRGRDDPLTREAWRFRRGLGRRGAAGRARLARRFPALAEAHAAYAAAAPLRRAELEARLLAGEDDAAVAAKTGLSPAGVAAFHSTFFEVRPHLKAGTYIATVVLRRRGRTGAAPDERAAALKALAHELGGWVVDKLLALFRDPPVVPAALGGLDLEALRGLRDRVRTKAVLLAETAPAAAAAPATWQWLAGRLAEAGGGAAGLGGGWGSVRAALDVVAGLSRGAVAAPDAGAAAGGDAQRPGGYGRRQAAVGRGRCARPALPA